MYRIPELDGLRGVAILAVLCVHCGLLPGGFLGVDIFFALSGYLITGILHKEYRAQGTIRLGRFYARRALRLFPALYLYVAVCLIWGLYTTLYSIPSWIAISSVLLYVSNWISVSFPASSTLTPLGPLDHTWSLSIEEQFYLTWPIALMAMMELTLKRRVIAGILVLFAIGSFYLRLTHHDGTLAHADGLLLGCACALVKADVFKWEAGLRRAAAVACWVVAFLFLAVPQANSLLYRISVFAASVATSIVLLAFSASPAPILRGALTTPALVYLGQRSYSLYLWHYPFSKYLLTADFQFPFAVKAAMTLSASFLVAELSYRIVERPFLRLKRDEGRTLPTLVSPPAPIEAGQANQ